MQTRMVRRGGALAGLGGSVSWPLSWLAVGWLTAGLGVQARLRLLWARGKPVLVGWLIDGSHAIVGIASTALRVLRIIVHYSSWYLKILCKISYEWKKSAETVRKQAGAKRPLGSRGDELRYSVSYGVCIHGFVVASWDTVFSAR